MEERRLEADAGLWLWPSPAEHLRRTQGETDGRMNEEAGKAVVTDWKMLGANAGSRKESTLMNLFSGPETGPFSAWNF